MTSLAFKVRDVAGYYPAVQIAIELANSIGWHDSAEADLAYIELVAKACRIRLEDLLVELERARREPAADARSGAEGTLAVVVDSGKTPGQETPTLETPQRAAAATFTASVIRVPRDTFTLPATRALDSNSRWNVETAVPELRVEATFPGQQWESGYRGALNLIYLLYKYGLTDVSALGLALTMAGYPDCESGEEVPFEKGWVQFDTLQMKTAAVEDLVTGTALGEIDVELRILKPDYAPEQQYALVLMVQLLRTLITHRVVSIKTLETVLLATGHRPVVVQVPE